MERVRPPRKKKGRPPIRKQQIKAWLDRQEDPEAWLTMTYKEIGEAVIPGKVIHPATVRDILPMIIADRDGILPSVVLKRKAEYRKEVEGNFTKYDILQLREWRSQSPPLEMADCAYRLDISINQVRAKCKELGLDER